MANTVTSQVLQDGERNAVLHVYIASDGAAGEETDTVIVDVSALADAPSLVKVSKIKALISGFSAVLEWDADTDVPFLALPDGTDVELDYSDVGGLQNNGGTGVTGDITITTTGFSAAGDAGAITLWVRKS